MFVTRNDLKLPEGCQRSAMPGRDQCMPTSGRKLPFLGPFASLSSAAMDHLPQSSNKCKKEQGTGMEFPEECCVLTDKNCPVLTGFGQVCCCPAQLTILCSSKTRESCCRVRNKKLMGMKNIKGVLTQGHSFIQLSDFNGKA